MDSFSHLCQQALLIKNKLEHFACKHFLYTLFFGIFCHKPSIIKYFISVMNPQQDLILNWRNPRAIRLSKILKLPQFDIGEPETNRCDTPMYGGKWIALYFLNK